MLATDGIRVNETGLAHLADQGFKEADRATNEVDREFWTRYGLNMAKEWSVASEARSAESRAYVFSFTASHPKGGE